MELCSMLCGGLDGRGVWGTMDTCICMAESLPVHLKLTTLLIDSTPTQNKKLKKKLEGDTAKVKRLRTEGHTVQRWNPACCCPACDPGRRYSTSRSLFLHLQNQVYNNVYVIEF